MKRYKVLVTRESEVFAENEQEAESLFNSINTVSVKATEIKEKRFAAGSIFKSEDLEMILVAVKSNSRMAISKVEADKADYFDFVIIKNNKGLNIGVSYGGRLIQNNKGVSLEEITNIYWMISGLEVVKPVYYTES